MKHAIIFCIFMIMVFCGPAQGADFVVWDAPASGGVPDGYYIEFTDGTTSYNSGPLGNVTEFPINDLNIPYDVVITYTIYAYNITGSKASDPIVWTRGSFVPPGQTLPALGETVPGAPGNTRMEDK